MKIVYCPECGEKMRDESIGWRCPKCKGFVSFIDGKFYPHIERPFVPPISNADRIRAMSNEELAAFLANPCQCDVDPERDGPRECGNDLCLKYLRDWLQQPAEEVCGMKGLYSKYEVRRRSDGTPVNNCFVLRPDRDDAAIAAMLAYADATSDSQLAKELREWVEFEQRVRCKEDSQ